MRRLLAPLRGPSQEPLERALRAIDNRLYRIEQTLTQQNTRVAALSEQLAQLRANPLQPVAAGVAVAALTRPRLHPFAPAHMGYGRSSSAL